MARRHARFAAGTTIEIDLERILLPRTGWGRWQEVGVPPCIRVRVDRELFDRRELLLLLE